MLVTIRDYEAEAERTLPAAVYDYFAGGAGDEVTLRENRRAFQRIRLRQRVLRGVAERDLGTTVLGRRVALPVLIAPTALQRMAHDEGELATARAAGAAGTIMTVSTMANHSLEEVAGAASGCLWFQVYVYRDRAITADMVRRAADAGYQALVLTADTPVVGSRERDARHGFRMPEGLDYANFRAHGSADMPVRGLLHALDHDVHDPFESGLTWDDVTWLRSLSDLPVIVKGVAHPHDAETAIEAGAAGLIVSNHGGRQLDTALPAVEALPDVVAAVKGRAEVLMDGGVRRGTDVLKALAMGASAVLVGRPVLWGLAAGGEEGVRGVLEVYRRELDSDMALAGFRSIDEIRTLGPSSLAPLARGHGPGATA